MTHRSHRRVDLLALLMSLVLSLCGFEIALRSLTDDRGELLGTRLVGPDLIDQERIRNDAALLRTAFDPELGWVRLVEGNAGEGGGAEAHAIARSGGARGKPSYSPEPPEGVVRVCAFGESFTYGDGVAAEESWPARTELHAGGRVEVLNFGVGGYGLDQAYLCFRRHAPRLDPDLILVGLTHHAIERTINIYHPYYTCDSGLALIKPRFIVQGDSLERLVPRLPDPIEFLDQLADFAHHPLRQYEGFYDPAIYDSSGMDRSRFLWLLRSRLAWRDRDRALTAERILDVQGEPIRVSRALIQRMAGESESLGARFVVVILPTRRILRILSRGDDLWAPVRDELSAAGLTVWMSGRSSPMTRASLATFSRTVT
jgi:hypothetical protein